MNIVNQDQLFFLGWYILCNNKIIKKKTSGISTKEKSDKRNEGLETRKCRGI